MSHNDVIETEIDSKISNLITNLRNMIDQFDVTSNTIRQYLLELARHLDEEKKCERYKICVLIKEMLKDKISDGKISARWIEDCLPKDYKRKYTKCEVASLLTSEIPMSSSCSSLIQQIEKKGDTNNGSSNNSVMDPLTEKDHVRKIAELEDALLKSNKFKLANELEQEFQIPKTMQEELNAAFECCREVIFVRFAVDGRLRSIKGDEIQGDESFRKDDSPNDNDM